MEDLQAQFDALQKENQSLQKHQEGMKSRGTKRVAELEAEIESYKSKIEGFLLLLLLLLPPFKLSFNLYL